MKKIIIAGGTGFLGNVLIEYFKAKTVHFVILTRGKTVQKENVKYINWDGTHLTGWESHLENADVLINLTGKSVDCRYHKKNKLEILNSRVNATNVLQKAIEKCKTPPAIWLNASTATIYKHSEDTPMTEKSGEIGDDFSMGVAKKWEQSFFKKSLQKTRKIALRTSIVLGKNGGAFIPLKNLTRFGLGGKQGKGTQMVSWIHEIDFARAIEFILNTPNLEGVINVTVPTPVKNKNFMKSLRKTMNKPFGLWAPALLLKIGAFFIRTETELILKSRYVIPLKLQEAGFQFNFKSPAKAFQNLLEKD
ncbi:TIGR01777 family oxidoreductase [Ascidiimonas sp. W6]|uniref:TIGR01777 family oxidoreductase n=1 Tax=Ascidiimonas meishanensis TaxID=3128903 RepID=UPI0030EEFAB1